MAPRSSELMLELRNRLDSWIANNVSPAARLGLIVLAALMAFWLWLMMSDLSSRLENDLIVAKEAAEEVPTQIWDERLSQVEARYRVLQSAFWFGATIGEVNARILNSVQQAAVTASMQEMRIETSPSLVDLGGIDASSIVVEGRASAQQILTFLSLLRSAEGQLLVQALSFRTSENGRLHLELLAPVAISDEVRGKTP